MKRFTLLNLLLIISVLPNFGQTVEATIKKIIQINEVHYKHMGFDGEPGENYKNYEQLRDQATINQLVELTKHDQAVVACYAGWALVDKGYTNLPAIFNSFLSSTQQMPTLSRYTSARDLLSDELYHRYWGDIKDWENDSLLMELDSMIIYQGTTYWLLLTRALENRIYPKSYNERIAFLAFDKGYRAAILYLSNWYKAAYVDQLKKALIKYLNNTDFSKVGTSTYFAIVAEILRFNDSKMNPIIIAKMKTDRHWEYDKEGFYYLLERYHIYESDLEH